MFLEEPKVEFVSLEMNMVTVNTGAGYTICQRITGGNVDCEGLISGSSVSSSEVCGTKTCDTSSDFSGDYYSF